MCTVMDGTFVALCWSCLESAQPLRKAMSVSLKLDNHALDVDIICKCMLPAQLPVLFRKVRNPSIPGTSFKIHSLPGLSRVQHYSCIHSFVCKFITVATMKIPVFRC
jgi:hypothetical protein